MSRSHPTSWLLAAAAALTVAAGTAMAAQADDPHTFSITPSSGSATTGVTASFTFTASADDPCKGQQVNFTWDGAPWGTVAHPTYIAGNGRCTASITKPSPNCSAANGPHTIAAAGSLGKDSGSATFTINQAPSSSDCQPPPPDPTPTPAPVTGPPAPPATDTPAPDPASTPAPTDTPQPTPAVDPSASPSPSASPIATDTPSPSPSGSPSPSSCPRAACINAVTPPPPPSSPPTAPMAAVLAGMVLVATAAGSVTILAGGVRKPATAATP